VFIAGALGVVTKFALRRLTWPDLVVSTALVYAAIAAFIVAAGAGTLRGGIGGGIAILAGICASSALILSFLALEHGRVGQVVPFMSAYPIVSAALGLLLLSETASWGHTLGIGLIIGGLVLLAH
jgi:uncharacterized membrane protein